ncbi:WD40-like Beta Propeller Repeat [Mucilaginibacter mallensis]|uniref:WD40-like Beta Propeller Repeat n=1 Tax=Mucilaginibacter mallensis TaxID=652787 RepID=A0A1H2AHI6_MUCMA|nr:PD40 domain-containing protein [Mucilaginibacter mallensis]SDT45458.1 WD40-like Beta Propeller Repeat [Mucilaginibacter mallensis]
MKLSITSAFIFAVGCCLPFAALCQGAPHYSSVIDTADRPQVFAPGIISTPNSEWATSFTPDEQTVYSSQGAIYWTIVFSKKQNGVWQKPNVAAFSGRFRDTDPFVTPDGKRIFFISNRPTPEMPQDKSQRAMHVWYADHLTGDNWGIPHHLDSIINLNGIGNYAPSVSAKGTLFYCSRRKELTGMQSFYATWLGDHYAAPKQLIIKGAAEIQDPFIAPDESYIIFLNGNDIYISFKKDGEWAEAQSLGPQVNNGDGNSSPCVSPDGRMLYYSSNRVQGFYKRDLSKPALNYDQLVQENNGLFNSNGNILMIPIHLPKS